MIGVLVILVLSWALLHWACQTNLGALGLLPISLRIKQLGLGFAIMAVLYLLVLLGESTIYHIQWSMNEMYEPTLVLQSLWYHFKSALTEDLIFRGALLYALINMAGSSRAIWVSAFTFGIYHLFSYGMIGGPVVPMIYIVITTGAMGYAWALAFSKTESIALPLGMHLAWNWMTSLFQEATPYGQLLYFGTNMITPDPGLEFGFQIIKGLGVPLILILIIQKYSMYGQKTVERSPQIK